MASPEQASNRRGRALEQGVGKVRCRLVVVPWNVNLSGYMLAPIRAEELTAQPDAVSAGIDRQRADRRMAGTAESSSKGPFGAYGS